MCRGRCAARMRCNAARPRRPGFAQPLEFDAIVTGVRAYNVRSDLRANENRLLSYVHDGGTLIVQYKFTLLRRYPRSYPHRPLIRCRSDKSAPLSEEAPVSFPNPDHPLLFTPNRSRSAFRRLGAGARGLFCHRVGSTLSARSGSHDPGDKAQLGGMLYTRIGKGFTSLLLNAFFRQLQPACRVLSHFRQTCSAPAKAARP